MRILSINVNNIQSAASNGMFDWLNAQNADVICLQNTNVSNEVMQSKDMQLHGYQLFSQEAHNPAQGGVCIYTKVQPRAVITNLGFVEADNYGRFIQLDFDKISIVSLLFPSGLQGGEELVHKQAFLQQLSPYLEKQSRKRRDYIYCCSTYIAHQKIDVKYWRECQHEIGFTLEEREWMDHIIRKLGYIDSLREVNRDNDQFSWWPDNDQALMLNLGWRFDYQLLTPALQRMVRSARLQRQARFSQHLPLQIDYNWELQP